MANIDEVLGELGNKITSIEDKVKIGTQQVSTYKRGIIAKLAEVVDSLAKLKDSDILKEIPLLRGQLAKSNAKLQLVTSELKEKTSQLEESKSSITNLQSDLQKINQQLQDKNRELDSAKESISSAENKTELAKKEKEKAISELTGQLEQLKQQKEATQKELTDAQSKIGTLVERISALNANLEIQIGKITAIADGLDINDREMSDKFKDITSNIIAITKLLNESDTSGPPPLNVSDFFDASEDAPLSAEDEALYKRFEDKENKYSFYKQIPNESETIITTNVREARNGDIKAKKTIVEELKKNKNKLSFLEGGKSRRNKKYRGRRTMKKHHRRSYKMKGGYVYSSSRDLDKASSIVNASSGSSKSSSSKFKSKSKSTYNKRLTKRHKLRK